MAIFDATLRLFSQQDLKRIVALTTVIEMNWLMLCFLLGDSQNIFLANFLIIAHVFSTTSEFLLVESLSKRYNSRDILYIGSLWYNSPNLWYISLFIIFITIGFPGTSIFLAKFIFLPTLLNYSLFLFVFILLIFFLILPIFFIRIWLPLWFGLYHKYNLNFYDLSKKEFFIFFISITFSIILGLFPNLFLFLFI
jgi:NADH:ubiquinone oxidoreductase subunit 4 (subunit M)